MKLKKEPIREDKYLNVKISTYSVDFSLLDKLLHDFRGFKYCIILNDGEKEIFLELSDSESDALKKHKENYDRLLLRPRQWFDIKKKKFKYVSYKEGNLSDLVTVF